MHSADVRSPVRDTLSARTTRDETSPRPSIVHPRRVLEKPTPKGGRKGKAPPVDSFSSENHPEDRFEDWLPTLERAALWNEWSDDLLQLAGHLEPVDK